MVPRPFPCIYTMSLPGFVWYFTGAIPNIIFSAVVSIASIVFVGASATRGPKGSYSVPEAGGIRFVSIPMPSHSCSNSIYR